MESEHSILMYYHTALRNVGMFTTVSFAALGYSRVYRGKIHIYNIYLIFASIIFMIVSLTLNWYLIQDYEYFLQNLKSPPIIASKWSFIPRIVFVFNIGMLILSSNTLYRELKI